MIIERANINDTEILTKITKKSKSYWGYSKEQLDIWSEVLTITKNYLETKEVFKLIFENSIIGYYSYFIEDEKCIKLDNMFVLPDYIWKGFGEILMNDFLIRIKATAAKKIMLDSEPNAENFYTKFGFNTIGKLQSSI